MSTSIDHGAPGGIHQRRRTVIVLLAALAGLVGFVRPGCCDDTSAEIRPDFSGAWRINDELSDDVDKLVERAIKKSGGKAKHSSREERELEGKANQGKYRGGPKEQEIYDHLAYDDSFRIEQKGPEFHFSYPGDFERRFFTDRRSRTATATGEGANVDNDFSFAYWEGDALLVESRPRDGGRALERYVLDPDTGQLRVELSLAPLKFPSRLEILRVFERADATGDSLPDSSE